MSASRPRAKMEAAAQTWWAHSTASAARAGRDPGVPSAGACAAPTAPRTRPVRLTGGSACVNPLTQVRPQLNTSFRPGRLLP